VRNDRLCTGTGACSSTVGCRARHHRGQGHRRVRGAVPGVLPLLRPWKACPRCRAACSTARAVSWLPGWRHAKGRPKPALLRESGWSSAAGPCHGDDGTLDAKPDPAGLRL